MRQEVLAGPERRRRWSDGEKIAIVREASDGASSVAEVAHRHDLSRQQIYLRRHSTPECVYIAASKRGQLLKVGSCSDVKQREQYLSAHKYGGFDDRQVIAWAKTPRMGEVEFDVHKKLAGLCVPGTYEKDGASQETRELFRGDLVSVWQAYHASTAAIENGRKWRHPGFTHFNFAATAKSGISR